MPQIKVRPYEEKDREAFFHVRAMTYNSGKPIPAEEQIFKTTRGYVCEVDGFIAGVFGILDFTCTRGEAVMKDAAVAGVAVLPEYRRSGVGGEMMTWGLRHFREEGIPMASLYAFRESYYRKFGYECCGSRLKITVPTASFPKIAPQVPVRRLDHGQADALKPCYESFSKARSGMNLRTDKHWSRVLGKDTTVYAAGDPVEAYLLIDHRWQFWENQEVSEIIWTTSRGYDSILATLAGIGINKTSVEWYEPSDSPFMARFWDHGVRTEIERLVMYRVTDVPASLRAIQPQASGEFTVSVQDPHISENEGPWRVAFSPSSVDVQPATTADLDLPIGLFTQALLGEPSLADMARNDRVCCRSQKAMDAAQALLPALPTYCTDFF